MNAQPLALAAATLVPHREPVGAQQVRALIDAAADACFDGLSIWTAHHDWAVADGMASQEFFDHHRERGLSVPAAEVVVEWATSDRRAVEEANSHILDVTALAGGSSVIAVTLEPELPPLRDAVTGLRALCDIAADRGLAVSFEFLPWTGVPDLAGAVRLLDAVDRDNLGLVLDTWHWFRQPGGPDVPTLRAIPAERIHMLQLNDAPAQPEGNPIVETVTARLLPGEGAIDIAGLLDVLSQMGAAPVIVSEVFSHALAAMGPLENARRQHAAATAVLAEAKHPPRLGRRGVQTVVW
jgi:sugar phosphate isomerase/epimerase